MWVTLFLGGGYFFENLPFIKHHFSYVLIGIIAISLIPKVVTFINGRRNIGSKKENAINTEY